MDVGHNKIIRRALDLATDKTTGVAPDLPVDIVSAMERAEAMMRAGSARTGYSKEAVCIMLVAVELIRKLREELLPSQEKPREEKQKQPAQR